LSRGPAESLYAAAQPRSRVWRAGIGPTSAAGATAARACRPLRPTSARRSCTSSRPGFALGRRGSCAKRLTRPGRARRGACRRGPRSGAWRRRDGPSCVTTPEAARPARPGPGARRCTRGLDRAVRRRGLGARRWRNRLEERRQRVSSCGCARSEEAIETTAQAGRGTFRRDEARSSSLACRLGLAERDDYGRQLAEAAAPAGRRTARGTSAEGWAAAELGTRRRERTLRVAQPRSFESLKGIEQK